MMGMRTWSQGTRVATVRRVPHGFTLMEILVALFIFASVVTLLSGAFDRIFTDIAALEGRDRLDRSGSACLEVMCADLHSLHFPLDAGDDDVNEGLLCPPDDDRSEFVLQFTSLNRYERAAAEPPGPARITYYLEPEEPPIQGFRLLRAERRFPREPFQPEPADAVLCRRVATIAIALVDREGGEHGSWGLDEAADGAAVPRSVRIAIELKHRDRAGRFQTQILLAGGEDV